MNIFQYKSLILLIFLIFSAYSATFDIKSVSTCTQQSTQGFCTRWEQNGSVQQTTGCFPSETQVYVLKNGEVIPTTMNRIQVGDLILTEKQEFNKVIGWLHKNQTMDYQFLKISTDTGSFMTSSLHNVALMNGSYIFAKDLSNQLLQNGERVVSIETKFKKGVFAPLTQSGNFYVKMGQTKKTLVHCYAYLADPQFYEPFVSAIFSIWETFYGVPQGQYVIHPAIQWMSETFKFLLVSQ